jgi:hypothetical protein
MKVIFGILALAVLGLVVAVIARRSAGHGGYRRRFANRYRHAEPETATNTVMWFPVMGISDSGNHLPSGGDCHVGSDAGSSSVDCGGGAGADGGSA